MINPATLEAGAPESTTTSSDSENIGKIVQGRTAGCRFTIAGDKIALATADMPERTRTAIRWAEGYCRARNLSYPELADRLKKPDGKTYSADSVFHMFTGGREADQLDNMVAALERLRVVETERAEQVRVTFIETSLSARIFSTCRRAFLRQKMVFIFGDSQIGKTTALEEYARRHNHGETRYVRMPPGGGLDAFIRELAIALGIPTGARTLDLRRRILDCFDSRMLLVVDECEECLNETSLRGVLTLNFIREIHDKRKCGVVMAGANIFKQKLLHGRHSASMVRLVRRGMSPLQLPAIPPSADLARFAESYRLPAIDDQKISVRAPIVDAHGEEQIEKIEHSPLALQTAVIREHGLGRWVMILTEASDLAREKRRPMSWGAVLLAWHRFEQDAHFAAQCAANEKAAA